MLLVLDLSRAFSFKKLDKAGFRSHDFRVLARKVSTTRRSPLLSANSKRRTAARLESGSNE